MNDKLGKQQDEVDSLEAENALIGANCAAQSVVVAPPVQMQSTAGIAVQSIERVQQQQISNACGTILQFCFSPRLV